MKKSIFISIVVSLGGFLFGFDAGIISGVMTYAGPEFNLNDAELGWVVSSPSFAAMFAMLISGKLSDQIESKRILLVVAFLYILSAILSAYATSYEMLYIARMIGGLAFGAALILTPTYIAEISTSENRGKLVSIQQLNIVLGFFGAFLSNYFFNEAFSSGKYSFLTHETIWRWMLGAELIPSLIYFIMLFLVPKSPRWLFNNNKRTEALQILTSIYGEAKAKKEISSFKISLHKLSEKSVQKINLKDLLKPSLKIVFTVGMVLGILQQITGINAIYFYATSIFKQTGIGTDASFSSGILLSLTTVFFTIIAMFLVDKLGRRPLLLVGVAGIAISLLLCAYGFHQATYKLTSEKIAQLNFEGKDRLQKYNEQNFTNDIAFKNTMKATLGNQLYAKNEGAILESAITMNANLVLVGVLGFIACFAFSLGPIMWVMLSELFPSSYKGFAIGVIGFVNSFVSWFVQQVFPWELTNLGNATTFLVFGVIAVIGFFILLKILPETKGKSLEQIQTDLVIA